MADQQHNHFLIWIEKGTSDETYSVASSYVRCFFNARTFAFRALKTLCNELYDIQEEYETGQRELIMLKPAIDYAVAKFKGKARPADPEPVKKFHQEISEALQSLNDNNAREAENFLEIFAIIRSEIDNLDAPETEG